MWGQEKILTLHIYIFQYSKSLIYSDPSVGVDNERRGRAKITERQVKTDRITRFFNFLIRCCKNDPREVSNLMIDNPL